MLIMGAMRYQRLEDYISTLTKTEKEQYNYLLKKYRLKNY